MKKNAFRRGFYFPAIITLTLGVGLVCSGYPFSSEDISDIVKAAPSSANESSSGNTEPAPGGVIPNDSGIPDLVRRVRPAVGAIVTFEKDGSQGQGSGVFISSSGEFLTNRHVIEGSAAAQIKLYNGKIYPVKSVLAVSPQLDLVKLQVGDPGDVFSPANIALSLPVIGERLITIGNPMGLEYSVADGLVSGYRDDPEDGRMMQVSVPISPGSSGGPLFNLKGQVVSIATFHIRGQNLNFAVPADRFKTLRNLPTPMTLAQWNHLPELKKIGRGDDLIQKASTEMELGNYSLALKYLEQAEQTPTDKETVEMNKAFCYLRLKNYTKSLQSVRAYIKGVPNCPPAYAFGAMVYITQKKYNEAEAFLREGIRQNPEDEKLRMMQGAVLVMKGNFREAVPVLTKAVQKYPEETFLQASLGYSYLATEKFELAKDQFRKAVKNDTGSEMLHVGFGLACLFTGDRAMAQEEYRKLQRMDYEYAPQLEGVINDFKEGNILIPPGELHANDLEGALVKSPNGTDLGKITFNASDPDSLLNPNGTYGSASQPDSIFNSSSPYGNSDSEYSAFAENAGWVPKIYYKGKFVGYLTINPFLFPRLNSKELRR